MGEWVENMNLFGWLRHQWDRALAVLSGTVGMVLLVGGWLGVSRSTLTTQQIPYLASGAVGGLFALGIAATLWLSADLRDEYRKLEEIHEWMKTNPQQVTDDSLGGHRTPDREGNDGRFKPVMTLKLSGDRRQTGDRK